MKKRGRKALRKEEIAEDWCFVCKDGGDLLICDYRQCLKAYHCQCAGKDETFLMSEESWNCDWHSCFICQGTSSFHCYCCPKAVCRYCIDGAEFVVARGKYGFCINCLKLALLIEENMDVDSDGERVDFKDLKTYEGLFMDYYCQMIKEKNILTLDHLHAAKDRLKTCKSDPDEFDNDEDDDNESDYESKDEKEDLELGHRKKNFKGQLKNAKSKKLLFTGWGSTPLVQFLDSIGQDTDKELPQHKVETLINAYIKEHELFDPGKKRKIICDEKLQAIFGRKVVNRGSIYSLLEAHFVSNLEETDEEEEIIYNSEDKDEDALAVCKTRRKLKGEKHSLKNEPVSSAPQSCFASISPENIKLVYLRKSLLQELSKEPESFQNKVIGSFIRIKTGPYDYCQRNSHQLLQVTGVKKNSTGENSTEMILQVSNMPLEIRISSLSDGDFEEAECEDLRQKVKDGLIQKPTVVELQQKARSLHEDITKNWIARELKLLDLRIDHANEKGWRRELYEYMEKRQLLQTQSEQLRLLKTYPTVIPEEIEPVIEEIVHSEGNEASPQSVFPTDLNCKLGGNGTSSDKKYPGDLSSQDEKQNLIEISLPVSPNQASDKKSNKTMAASSQDEKQNLIEISLPVSPNQASAEKSNKTMAATLEGSPEQPPAFEHQWKLRFQGNDEMSSPYISGMKQNQQIDAEHIASERQEPVADKVIIDLSSDDESTRSAALRKQNLEDPESRGWLILGPNGERNGKYSLSLLKSWSEASPYALKFKVWKETETEEQAIWLHDAIKLTFTGQ